MKFSKDDIAILKNFASINPGIELKRGNIQRSMHKNKVTLAEAELSQSIPVNFVIWDLNSLLTVHSILEEPEIDMDSSFITMSDGRRRARYRTADRSVIDIPPSKNFDLPVPKAEFVVSAKELNSLREFSRVFNHDHLIVKSIDGIIQIESDDISNPNADNMSVNTDTHTDNDFEVIFRVDNLKLIEGSYKISLTDKVGIFENQEKPIKYWVAMEGKSRI